LKEHVAIDAAEENEDNAEPKDVSTVEGPAKGLGAPPAERIRFLVVLSLF
jgi:hypothetical protein